MYLEYFNLNKHPFQLKPDPELLYLSQKHARAFVYMDYAAWQPEGFVVITGEVGSGKSTLIKKLLASYREKVFCFHINFTSLSGGELLSYIARQAGIMIENEKDKISILFRIMEQLKDYQARGIPCVLVVDEAQNLSYENLEEIRMLAGLEGEDGPILRVVMLGQPEFIDAIDNLEQLKQRIKLHYHIGPLDLDEVTSYINFRLAGCGFSGDALFSDELVLAIYEASGGIPRLINKLCDSLLMCAFADRKPLPDISDLAEIQNDILLVKAARNLPAESPSVTANAGISKSDVERIVTSLETIGAALQAILAREANNV
ncbi:MAG: AAA family ATPase [Oceanospirillaceae bacterium]|nr:AAA family ATPase [Oceanospirillaceae bacterium]MCP5335208.1 AAA family ATPase [Oceanospirillaceae bacterium]